MLVNREAGGAPAVCRRGTRACRGLSARLGAHARARVVAAVLALVPRPAGGVTFVRISADIATDTRWSANQVYILDRPVFVRAPATLIVEGGTIVRGEGPTVTGAGPGSPGDPGALVVCRGARLVADGSAESPVIFTSIDDPAVPGGEATIPGAENPGAAHGFRDLTNPANRRAYQTADLHAENAFCHAGLWGGIAVLGRARVAQNNPTGANLGADPPAGAAANTGAGVDFLEAFAGDPRSLYGGADDADGSGILRFVSIRYAGARAWGDLRLPALTLAGVGAGTRVDFVEVWNSAGDGFHLRGGAASLKYVAAWFAGAGAFAWDEGFHGRGQYWFAIQDNATGSGRDPVRGAGAALLDAQGPEPDWSDPAGPYSVPTIANATLIGRGWDSANAAPRNGLRFCRNSGGHLRNVVVLDTFDAALWVQERPMQEERLIRTRPGGGPFNFAADASSAPGPDLSLEPVLWHAIGADGPTTAAAVNGGANDAIVAPALGGGVFDADPALAGLGRLNEAALLPTAGPGSVLRASSRVPPADGFFAPVMFLGAFRDANWLAGWSVAARLGAMSSHPGRGAPPAVRIGFAATNTVVAFPSAMDVAYVVEHSDDLKVYRPIGAVVAAGANTSVTHTNGAGAPRAFYRVLVQ